MALTLASKEPSMILRWYNGMSAMLKFYKETRRLDDRQVRRPATSDGTLGEISADLGRSRRHLGM